MDLEVVGRHALLFDDDSMAAFVNSRDALVEWNSLSIDRYDVRHLLSAPPPPRRRRNQSSPLSHADSSLESELDHERYLDLPPDEEGPGVENGAESVNLGGFNAVPFSYGNTDESSDQKTVDSDSAFRPSFQVPEDLLQNLPPTEKVHQIMARTALFVSKHGGQSEIVLRVKQGNNPAFGFLMPDHHLHPYFRFLVDHQELLSSDTDGKSSETEKRGDSEVEHSGGALSLLGSVYGTGEDEDGAAEAPQESRKNKSEETSVHSVPISLASEGRDSSVTVAEKDEPVPKHAALSLKDKGALIKKNRPISTVKVGTEDGVKKDSEGASLGASGEKKSSTFSGPARAEPIIEPPSELKRVVEKIVEFILRNGRQFESILIEQDRNYGRFPFLLPSNQYHPYYIKVLQSDKESKLPGTKNESSGHGVEKKSRQSKERESYSPGSDIPDELNKKGKFKMVIPPNKKRDESDQPPREPNPEMAVGVDAAAAAAILQAVRKGIKHPNLEILPKASGSDSSQPQKSREQRFSSVPTAAKAIAETAAMAAAGEADSSEAGLTREQKLKAERLKRAKMFAAMLKVGSVPSSKTATDSVVGSGSGAEVAEREREGSSVPPDIDAIARRSKRSYRSRKDVDGEKENEEEEEKGEDGDERDEKHSRKKRRHSHRSSHKHRKRDSSSKEGESSRHRRHKHKHDDISSDDDDDEYHRKHRRESYEDEDGKRSRRRHRRRSRSRSRMGKEEDVEEGEVSGKSGESRASGGDGVVREVSQPVLETSTEVPDDLRAKIRAMLMATM